MDRIEQFLRRVCRSLRVASGLRDHISEELREHLKESVEAHMSEGLTEDAAMTKAIEEFGDAANLGGELCCVHSQGLVSFLLERAMSWRERTMKTGWKWHFVAVATLVVIIAANVALTVASAKFVYPKVTTTLAELDVRLLPMTKSIFAFVDILRKKWLLLLSPVLVLVVGSWITFAWLYRGENRSQIKLASLALLALATTVLCMTVCLGALIPAAMLAPTAWLAPSYSHGLPSAALLKAKLSEADILMSELNEAATGHDWSAAKDSVHDLGNILQAVALTRDLGALLKSAGISANAASFRAKADDLLGSCFHIAHRLRDGETDAATQDLHALQQSYTAWRTPGASG